MLVDFNSTPHQPTMHAQRWASSIVWSVSSHILSHHFTSRLSAASRAYKLLTVSPPLSRASHDGTALLCLVSPARRFRVTHSLLLP